MAIQEDGEVTLISVPDPNSDGMVTLLSQMFEDFLAQLPFPFSYGDAMGAALYLVVDSGLINASSPQKLRQDIVEGMDRILAERAAEKGKMN